jgi:nucleoside diphosphate kinase
MASSPDATFTAEYTDPSSGLKRLYTMGFWNIDRSVSLFDRATKRTFLRRTVPTEAEPLRFELLRPGATVMVCGRPLAILDQIKSEPPESPAQESTLMLIKAYANMADIIEVLQAAGCRIERIQMLRLDAEEAAAFAALNDHSATVSLETLQAEFLVAVEVARSDCVATVQQLCGPADPKEASYIAPSSLR